MESNDSYIADSNLGYFISIIMTVQISIISFMNPIIVIIGTIGNFIIIILFSRKLVKMNANAKIYTVVIAFGDLGVLIFFHLREFLSVGLWFLTSGKFYLFYYYPFHCKILTSSYLFFYSIAMYAVIAFSIERNIALST